MVLALSGPSGARFTYQGVSFWSAPDHTRVVMALVGPAKAKVKRRGKLLVVHVRSRIKGPYHRILKVNDDLISLIRVERARGGVSLFIHMKKKTSFRVFTIKKHKGLPFRVVVDVLKPPSYLARQKKRRLEVGESARKRHKYIVVLDPGHGGSDPGAIGLYGIREKDIVLDISKRIARYCNSYNNIQVFLTRKGDYYIPLQKRVEIAHDYGADLFISVHSNKAPDRRIDGVMAFVLSKRGARSSLVRMLEDIENTEDIVKDIKLSRSRTTNRVVLDVAHQFSITEGERAGKLILAYLSYMAGMKNRGIRKASLKVLKNPGIPSVLLEIGFLSNKRDVGRLKSRTYRDRIAYSVCKGIVAYFNYRDRIKRMRYYMVKKGDTLWKIARMHNTTVDKLMAVNNLRSSRLYPGMKLFVP